jgi:antirestriction protein
MGIQIYVACLRAYNNGILHGRWINATLGEDHIKEEVEAMLKESPEDGEEWAIHDYQGFGEITIHEYQDFRSIADLAEAIEEHGEIITLLHDELSNDSISATIEHFKDYYLGSYESETDYALEYYENTGQKVDDFIYYHIDFRAMGKDLLTDCVHFWHDNELHVFCA